MMHEKKNPCATRKIVNNCNKITKTIVCRNFMRTQTSQCKSEKGNFMVIELLGKSRRVCLAFGQIVQLFPTSLG